MGNCLFLSPQVSLLYGDKRKQQDPSYLFSEWERHPRVKRKNKYSGGEA